MKIRTRIGLLAGILLLILAVITINGVVSNVRLSEANSKILEKSHEMHAIMDRLLSRISGSSQADNIDLLEMHNQHDLADKENTAAENEFLQIQKQLIVTNSSLILFLFVYILLAAAYVIRSIVYPLALLSKTAQKIGDGDLSARVTVIAKDEIGELAAVFNFMVSRLEKNFIQIKEQKERLANVNEELGASNENLQKNMAELEEQQTLFIGREKRVLELKTEVNTLLKELGREDKYLGEDLQHKGVI